MTSVKHSISVAGHKQVPWAPQMQAALFSAPGWQDGTLAQRFVDILSVRLCGSTVGPYTSKLNKFFDFCTSHGLVSVPASAQTVYEYLAFLSLEGAVHPQYWMQYVAVVTSMHKDLGLPTPWMDSGLCTTFSKSAAKLVTSAAVQHPSRKPLLAEHVMLFLREAMFTTDLALLRAAVAVYVAFTTFVRGASLMSLSVQDVHFLGTGLEVAVWDEKTRKGAGVARSLTISFPDCQFIGQVLHRFFQFRQEAFGASTPQGFLQLPGENFPLKEGILHHCMQQCVAAVHLTGVYGAALKGHSCRSGGVSALHALGGSVPLATARGGWQSVATVFEHYLSFEVLPSKEAFLLLGFLLPPPVYEAGKGVYGI